MDKTYKPGTIEPKWQQLWQRSGIYRATETGDRPKYYCLDYFPYPSGEGLHVGHCRNYVPTDVISRYMRMQGYNVLHPMGWDAFGEPAEQYAISQGVNPQVTTAANAANFRRQMNLIGASYDWSREINSSDPAYYRWTQWFFLLLYQRGLAYRDTHWQWWCPTCQTTLSSHEATGGVCWRGHPGVTKREIPAWYFRITAYAEELITGLDEVEWPEHVKATQRNWIGRSEGIEVDFPLVASLDQAHLPQAEKVIKVFTTRPDTIYGATFLVLAPEHPLAQTVTRPDYRRAVDDYIERAIRRSEVERMLENREKTGVFTGAEAFNPLNGLSLPIWVADYVLPSYGTGAVMGVPAHDQRDFTFARSYGLPVIQVVARDGEPQENPTEAYTGSGVAVNSGPFTGLTTSACSQQIGDYIEARRFGRRTVQYRMRDWLISRQRYWGTPIPIVYCDSCGEVPVPPEQLPILLPDIQDYQPDGSGRSPLARVPTFIETTCPKCGGAARRESDTMGGFACSSWYYLRFASPHYHQGPFEPQAMQYWLPVDLYVGGAEHAVLHLLYARFWTKVMADAGLVPFREPFTRLLNQGQLMGPDGVRMSKSRGNVITPDSVVKEVGADALRVYELFMAPFDQDISWNTDGINGARRFLNRVWQLVRYTWEHPEFRSKVHAQVPVDGAGLEILHRMHRTIRQVDERIKEFRFNTAVSALMEFVNFLFEQRETGKGHTKAFYHSIETMLVLLAPIAPHIAEELWAQTGHTESIHLQSWPSWDEHLARDEIIAIPVQVNGKTRDVIEVSENTGQAEVEGIAMNRPKVGSHLTGRKIVKVVYVPGKVLNLVTRQG